MKQINTFNQWGRYATQRQLKIHTSGAVQSFQGYLPGFDTGFVSAARSWSALARYASRGWVRVGPSLRRQLKARGLI